MSSYPHVHICRGTNVRYVGRVRRPGARRYTQVGKQWTSYEKAFRSMTREFLKGGYKRGDVIMTADWYEPVILAEVVRK